METIADWAKANLVQFVDVPEVQIAEGVTAAETVFTVHPDVKVILVTSDGCAQGATEAMAAYAPDNLDEYAVYSGDISPDTQEALPKCELRHIAVRVPSEVLWRASSNPPTTS